MPAKKSATAGNGSVAEHKSSGTAKAAKKSAGKATAAAKQSPSGKKSAAKKSPDKYTDPDLRERIKEEVQAGDKGGEPGQWSARKAQMVAHEYEAQGGGYKGGPDETQQSLQKWGGEHWTTKDGSPAKQADGMHRYLPEKAWDKLTDAQKTATDTKKLKGSGEGKQFVANTAPAKAARKKAATPKK